MIIIIIIMIITIIIMIVTIIIMNMQNKLYSIQFFSVPSDPIDQPVPEQRSRSSRISPNS